MFQILSRYFHTIRYLKWVQIWYRLRYFLENKLEEYYTIKPLQPSSPQTASQPLVLIDSIDSPGAYFAPGRFRFLNLEYEFNGAIDWNFKGHGKLWTYNLNYFEFLSQPGVNKATGLNLIRDFIRQENRLQDGMEPFPISLRTIFWVRFLTQHSIRDELIDRSLYRQLLRLNDRLEYHLLGNHLLENAFALLFGARYFSDSRLFQKAAVLLRQQLDEQILSDGAHFELSPMYHQLLLYRLLDAINLLVHNPGEGGNLLTLLKHKAGMMLGWLRQMLFADGSLPRVNDSAPGIAPGPAALFDYAARLGVDMIPLPLGASGYRKSNTGRFELLIDAGPVGPDYIPGHAHSDTFNFVLHHRYRPLIVDTGISTYEKNSRRTLERSTASHNTVMVAGREQSEVWGGFRVARRARVTSLTEANGKLVATHLGYRHIGVQHLRSFSWNDQQIEIHDQLTGDQAACAFLHFHPSVHLQLKGKSVVGNFGAIHFNTFPIKLSLQKYDYALGFNRLTEAQKVVIHFKHELRTKIQLL